MIGVAVDHFDPATGIAPISVLSEPLFDGLSLRQLSRSVPLGWASPVFVTATDTSPQRFLVSLDPDEPAKPASSQPSGGLLIDLCRFIARECDTSVPVDIAYGTSDPKIARFVAVRGGSDERGEPQILLDASGHVVDDPRGVLCPLA